MAEGTRLSEIVVGRIADQARRTARPRGIKAIICSHGHFDHTTGLSGLIGRVGREILPVPIHPEFWARRHLATSPDTGWSS